MTYTSYKENKAKFRSILKKYSNISLFERREKELISIKKHKETHPHNLLIKSIIKNNQLFYTDNILNMNVRHCWNMPARLAFDIFSIGQLF